MPNAFPNVVRGKPTLALTTKELDVAIADAEEAYVFGSGMERDKKLSTRLQELRDFREERSIEVIQSRLIVETARWDLGGGLIRVNPQFGETRNFGYLCVLPSNEVIPTGGSTGVRNYVPIIFQEPVTGYLVEFYHTNEWSTINEWLQYEPFFRFKQFMCDDEDIPYGQFDDPPDLDFD